jgi:hypothetical protein
MVRLVGRREESSELDERLMANLRLFRKVRLFAFAVSANVRLGFVAGGGVCKCLRSLGGSTGSPADPSCGSPFRVVRVTDNNTPE